MSESLQRDEAIFEAALKLPPERRAAYLQDACGNDATLRSRVEALLRAHEESGEFLQEPAAGKSKTIVLTLPPEEKPGDRIGRYKLLQQIGEGGCGVVCMAEQEEPVRRRVALKVIKLGMDTKTVIARFEAERQALAMMDHPNIAKVLDAGATETGRPFFVMELVRGIKITDYCDQNKLSTRERLELFIQVCNAIQHAHQKGIIHRDIKPSNILVTLHDGVPVPKVIDFGIAKATQGRLTDQTLFTAFEQFIGTPAYMSPEQAEMSGLDIDTRSDIYALGVLLYELLTGMTPFDAKELLQSGLDELRRTIREKEPARPSTRLSTMLIADLSLVAQRRHAEAPKLIHLVRGDLDWIVMKALEKDRTRRYETANGLAMDVQRYLNNEPVVARPPSTIYKFQKLVLRNKTIFAAAGAGMAALIIGLVVALYSFAQAKAALKRAVTAEQSERQLRQQAEKIADMSRVISRAGLLLMSGNYGESEKILRDVPPHATMVPFYNVFGTAHARHGEWLEALTNWNYVVQFAPGDHIGYQYLGPLLAQINDVEGYKKFRAQIIQQFGDTSDSRIAERMVKASLLLPASAEEMKVISAMADVAGNVNTNGKNWGYNFLAKGLSEYRRGNYQEAIPWLRGALPEDIGSRRRAEAYLILAMTQYRLNQSDSSRASFSQAMDVVKALPTANDFADDWNDWVIIHVFLREALALNPDFEKLSSAGAAKIPAWQDALSKAAWKFNARKDDDGSWEVDLEDQPVTDISVLHDANISELSLMRTAVATLEPLRGMPLKRLWLASTKVTDLSPLQGMQLVSLQISGTAVVNLEPLRGMPLHDLRMSSCTNITNLEPIAGNRTLENVILPPNANGFEFLRGLASLKKLSFRYDSATKGPAQSAAEFWADYDKNQPEAKAH
jgi:eukaryotic-like serine/threonine-protein kinase